MNAVPVSFSRARASRPPCSYNGLDIDELNLGNDEIFSAARQRDRSIMDQDRPGSVDVRALSAFIASAPVGMRFWA